MSTDRGNVPDDDGRHKELLRKPFSPRPAAAARFAESDLMYLRRYGVRLKALAHGNLLPTTPAQEYFRAVFDAMPRNADDAIAYLLDVLNRDPREPRQVRLWASYLFQVLVVKTKFAQQEYRQIPHEGVGSREDFEKLHRKRR